MQEAARIPGKTAGFGASETWRSLSAGTGPFVWRPVVPGVITLGDGMISCHLFSPVVS